MKFKKSTYRKTMNTAARVGGVASKAALGAAIYSNPAILGTVAGAYGAGAALGAVQKYGDRSFKGKTGAGARVYRSSMDVANFGISYAKRDKAGMAMAGAKLIGDTGFLSTNAQKKYTSVNNNYIMPTLKVASAAQSTQKAYNASNTKLKAD